MTGLEMVEHLVGFHSFLLIRLQRFFQERRSSFGKFRRKDVPDGNGLHLGLELCLGATAPWSVARQHFVENYSNGPNVAFVAIFIGVKGLWGHINR